MLLHAVALVLLGHASTPTGSNEFELAPAGARAALDKHLTVSIDERGAALIGTNWSGRLSTATFGRASDPSSAASTGARFDPARVELLRGDVTEWFVRGPDGVEQGWTIAAPPAGASFERVWIGLDVEGDIALRIADDGLSAQFVDGRGAPVASYRGLCAFDAHGRPLEARLQSSPRGAGIAVDDRDAAYPITVDPWIGTPYWSRTGPAANQYFGTSVRGAGDVNNDGFSDVVIASNGYIQVFHGASFGLNQAPSTTINDPGSSSKFGHSVSAAGDFNGDGFDDVVVGAPYDSALQFQAGKVYVFPGSASGVTSSPIYTYALPSYYSGGPPAWCGWSVTFVGDMDADGRDEIAFGIPYDNPTGGTIGSPGTVRLVYGGTASMTTISPPSPLNQGGFGWAVTNAGDTDADGDMELFVTARDYNNGGPLAGAIFGVRFAGTTPSAGLSITGASGGDQCGNMLGAGGDVNGDGRTDLIAGSPGYSSNLGRITVLNGCPPGGACGPALWTRDGLTAGERFGESVAIVGDVNGDGFADFVVGAPRYNGEEGRASLYFGGATISSSSWAFDAIGDDFEQHTGAAVAAAGDVNGDGYGDFLVSAPNCMNYTQVPPLLNAGRVWLIYGHASEPWVVSAWQGSYAQLNAHAGYATSYIGDVNGDGFDDVALAIENASNGQTSEGRVEIYAGSASGVATTLLSAVEPNVANARFGRAIAGLGDVDGDGYADVAVGAPFYTNGEADEGAVFVYRGSATGLVTTPAWTIQGNFPGIHWGSAIASSLDVNSDGFGDLAIGCRDCFSSFGGEGEVWVYFGGPLGLSLSNPWVARGGQANAHLGESVASAGDIDGDGYGDLIAGAPDFENGQSGEGAIYIWRGSLTGLASTPLVTSEGDYPNIHWGRRVAGIGDVNGDGYADIVIGCPECTSSQPEEGEAWVVYGAPGGLSGGWVKGSGQAYAHYGFAVAGAGDVNGDGFGDFIVGTPDYDAPLPEDGLVEVYLGSSSGLASSPALLISGLAYGLGSSVGTAGDVNGDGFADVLFSAPYRPVSVGGEGKLYLHQGNTLGQGSDFRSGVKTRAQQRRETNFQAVQLGGSPHDLDTFRMSLKCYGALATTSSPAGRTRVKWQHETRERTDPFQPSGYSTTTIWRPTGSPVPGGLSESLYLSGLQSLRGYKWRVRCIFDDPFFPRTPWATLSGRSMSETKLRMPRDCNGNGAVDHVEIAGGAPDTNHDQLLDSCGTIGTPFCFGNASSTACPCGNNSASLTAQVGCLSSLGIGAALIANGNASISADTLVLNGSAMPNSSALYFEGTLQQNGGLGTAFGDGKRCAGGAIVRLGTKNNVAGASSYPVAGDAAIHTKRPITVPGTYTYQVWYRNAAAFCTAFTFNLSNGVEIAWGP